jgi:hypothetical protein
MDLKLGIVLLLAGTGFCARASVLAWPEDKLWTPLTSDASLYADEVKDIGNNGHLYLDIVGGTDSLGNDYAGGYLLYQEATSPNTEDLLFLRIRLNKKKNQNNSGAYQVFFETDGDDSVEWVLQFSAERNINNSYLEFGSASGTNRAGVTLGAVNWSGQYPEYGHFADTTTADGSEFDGDADYFLDLAMPWQVFESYTGISSTNEAFRLLITSSQSIGQVLDGDVGGSDVTPNQDFLFSDEYTEAIPEPLVVSLLAGFGISLLACRRLFG